MGRCRLADEPHDYQFMFTLGNTKVLTEAVFGCPCGMMKKIHMRWDFQKLHPDERIKHMKARAESTAQEEESNGDENS